MSGAERLARFEPDVQRADPRARRRAMALVALAAIAGGVAIFLTQAWLDEVRAVAAPDPRRAAMELAAAIRLLAALLPLPLVAFAAYGFRLAARTRAAQRFPPPGMAVTRDTKILVGAAAGARARLLTLLMALLLGAAVAIPFVMMRAADALIAASGS